MKVLYYYSYRMGMRRGGEGGYGERAAESTSQVSAVSSSPTTQRAIGVCRSGTRTLWPQEALNSSVRYYQWSRCFLCNDTSKQH